MKVPEKTKEKKDKIKKKEKMKPKKDHVLIVAQEIKFARLLSGNEKKSRDKVLNTLKKWLLNCFEKGYEFKEDDFIRVWKGLFYAVWMSDKPLVQEELSEKIAGVLDLFPVEHLSHALLMFKAGIRVLATQWYGLDQHRTDKFLMLVRRYLRASLRCLLRSEWSLESCQMYANTLSGSDGIFALYTPLYARNAMSLLLHIVDCYLEEIAKVSNGDIPDESLVELLRPLCTYMCRGEAPLLCAAVRRLLTALVRQSDQGLRYQHATAAWQKMGCPEGGPEALELVSDSEDDDEKDGDQVSTDEDDESRPRALDPRAGRVHVELASLPVPAGRIADLLRELRATASSGRHKRVSICLERFEKLARSEYPLPVSTHSEDSPAPPIKQKKSAQSLHALEKKLVAASDELALRGLSRKHRKRLLAKSRSGTSIVEEVETVRQKLSTNVTNGGWQVEPAEPETKKAKVKNTINKENKKRKKNVGDSNSNKKPKLEAKFNGDTTHKQHKADKKQSDPSEKTVLNNLDNSKRIANGPKKDNTSQSGKKNNEKVTKITENGVKNDTNKVKVRGKVLDSKTQNSDNHKSTDKPRNDNIIVNDKKKKLRDNIKNNMKIENNVTKPDKNLTKPDKNLTKPDKNLTKPEKILRKPENNFANLETILTRTQKILTETEKILAQPEKILASLEKNLTIPAKNPTLLVSKVKQFQKKTELQKQMTKFNKKSQNNSGTLKKVKFVLKNNSMQQPVDYYKSVRQSPSIPFDSSKKPSKTNLKPSTPSPINPFFKKKLRLKQ